MDFNDTPEEAAFRAEARAWLEANAPSAWGEMADRNVALSDEQFVAISKAWQARKFDAGYSALAWPPEFGGRNASRIQEVIYRQEEARYAPPGGIFSIGIDIEIPIVHAFGTADQRERYVKRGLRGEEIWCQLFSEPAAGSDVAGIRTSAVRDGDTWVVSGQKIWTSWAHFSDFGTLLVRTDPHAPKHKGLSMFVLDMKAPGVTVRPVKQMTGGSEFNEVFFDEVRIPESQLLGAVGDGWKVAVATLMHERSSVGLGLGFVDYEELIGIAGRTTLGGRPSLEDGRVRERIADMYLNTRALTLLAFRAQTALSRGETPGPEQSITKAVSAAQGQQASYLAMDLMDRAGLLTAESLGEAWGAVSHSWAWGAAMRIAGGSDEILRNILAERVLGLPGDIRVDKTLPFDQLPA